MRLWHRIWGQLLGLTVGGLSNFSLFLLCCLLQRAYEQGGYEVIVAGVKRRLLPVIPFLVADAVGAWGITLIKAQRCWLCPIPWEMMSDHNASYDLRRAEDMYSLLDRAAAGDEEALEELNELSQHSDLQEVSIRWHVTLSCSFVFSLRLG